MISQNKIWRNCRVCNYFILAGLGIQELPEMILLNQIYCCNLVSASKSFHFLKFLMLSCKVNLTHETLKLPSYRNQSNDLQSNQLTGFFMMATLAFNELIVKSIHKTLTFPLNLFTIIALFPFK